MHASTMTAIVRYKASRAWAFRKRAQRPFTRLSTRTHGLTYYKALISQTLIVPAIVPAMSPPSFRGLGAASKAPSG